MKALWIAAIIVAGLVMFSSALLFLSLTHITEADLIATGAFLKILLGGTVLAALFAASLWVSKIACERLQWSTSMLSLVYVALFLCLGVAGVEGQSNYAVQIAPLMLVVSAVLKLSGRTHAASAGGQT